MKISSVLSAITNLALIGFDLTSTPSFFESFSASSSLSEIITLTSTFLFFSFVKMSLNIFSFDESSYDEEVRWIVLWADSMTARIWMYRFERPLIEVESSWFLIGSNPVLCSSCSSLYSVVSFRFTSVLIFSSAYFIVLFFSFSITVSGLIARYLTGLPSFWITNPRFSRDSRTS